jgi:hypothetical protein
MSEFKKFAEYGIIVNAQEYAKWREWLAPGRWFSEFAFKDYASVLNSLREVDDKLRDIAKGGSAYNISIKDALNEAKQALKDNRLIDAVYYSAIIGAMAEEISTTAKPFVDQVRTELYKQYGGTQQPKAFEMMESLQRKQQTAQAIADNSEQIIRHAQLLQNLYRGFFGGLDPLQRTWQSEIKQFRGPVEKLVNEAERFANAILLSFDKLGIARANGRLGDWVREISTLPQRAEAYDATVMNAFKAIQPIVELTKQDPEVKKMMSQKADSDMIQQVLLDIHQKKQEGESAEPMQHGAPVEPDRSAEMPTTPSEDFGKPKVTENVPEAGEPTGGQPVEPGVEGSANRPEPYVWRPATSAEGKPKPADTVIDEPPKRGPCRPTKKDQPITENMGIDPIAYRDFLRQQGKSEKEIEQAFITVGLDPDMAKEPEGVSPTVIDEETEGPMDFKEAMDYLDDLTDEERYAAYELFKSVDEGVDEGIIQDNKGNILGTIADDVVNVEGTDMEIPVDMAPKLLGYMHVAGLLPEKPESSRVVPMGPTDIGPGDEPVITPPQLNEPAVEEPTASEPAKTEVKEVDPAETPKKGSDRAIIFSNNVEADRKTLQKLNSVLHKKISVQRPTDAEKIKKLYPGADFYSLGDATDDTKISPEVVGLLKAGKTGKDGKIPEDIKKQIQGLIGSTEPKAKTEEEKAELGVAKRKKKEAPKKEAPKSEEPKVDPEPEPEKEPEAQVGKGGEATYGNTTASVNAGRIASLLEIPEKANAILIGVQGATLPQLKASEAALASFFNKPVKLVTNEDAARNELNNLKNKFENVAVFTWDRSDFSSAMDFREGRESTIEASVDQAMLKLSHKKFYSQLKEAAKMNDPFLLAQMMLRYSEVMEDKDNDLSIKLLAKAQEILNV